MTQTQGNEDEPVHILIAEDSPTQAQRLRYILEHNGYEVTSTTNGRKAIEAARAQKPTLVISDVLMPEMDGYQLCEQVKSDANLNNVPVILVTTLSDPQDVIRGLACRADNFIIKPYDERYLLSRIQFVLANYEMREHDHADMGVEIYFNGQRHMITAGRLQILNLLLSTYEAAIQRNHELTRTKDDLRTANTSLEATNKELEAFSYSVSHDLRAPLRAIDGFNQALIDRYADRLDDDARDLLQRIRAASGRMAQLIDDLLNLSRLGRTQVNREHVDLSTLARSVAADLRSSHPNRNVEFTATDELVTRADARLMRVVLENLLSNAWKFTAKRDRACIEFGRTRQGEEEPFYLRDNGAGFDMTYAGKLFGAFQRLHSASEFPGTGIGLATAQRIIHRHGGRIWAEGAVDVGATFYFTL